MPQKIRLLKKNSPSPESRGYQKMLGVLKQFRVVITHIKEHYRDIEKATGISGAQLWALYAIAQRPAITVGQLAAELAIHQSTASNLLDRLTQLGYIERKRETGDQRVVTVHLTTRGKQAVNNAPKPAIGILQQALLSLPESQLDGLRVQLDEVIKAIGTSRATGINTPLSTSLGEVKRRE